MKANQWNQLMQSAGAFAAEGRARLKPEYRDALDKTIRNGGRVDVRIGLGIADLRARLVAIEADGTEWQAGPELVMQMTQTDLEA